ncbi:MAG TPA: hypothetical protein VEG30_01050 [Terriglobales bacterium]|nr:hypothetical protein [Terriglobales bacterium]
MIKGATLAFVLAVAIAGILPTAASQTPSPQGIPVDKEPLHHVVFENAYTRVFSVQLPPHSQTMLHRHDRDYVYVTFGASEIVNDVLGKPPVHVKLQDGEAGFVKGGFEHVARNLAETPFRTFAIEVKRKPKRVMSAEKVERGLELGHGAISEVVLDNEEVRIRDVQLSPSAMLHATKMLPYLLVAVTDLDLRDGAADRADAHLSQKVGGLAWRPAETAMITNQAQQNARFVTVEFK